MKTLELVTWKRNENMSNIYVSSIGGDPLILKPFFTAVFEDCASLLKAAKMSSFVHDVWDPICTRQCDAARDCISQALVKNGFQADSSAVDRVIRKFRGNLGEMLVEMLAENGILDFIKPGTYETVDPTHEEFYDARAVRNGLPVGIQVKNYSKYNYVDEEVFLKAAAQSDLWLRKDRVVSQAEDIAEFISTPCQYIISTSEPKNPQCLDWFKGSVVFLGPKWLDSKRLTGSSKTGESSKWRMFDDVAKMIAAC